MNEIAMPTNWEAMKEQANMLVKSGFLPPTVNTPEKAIAIALTGKELGIGMMEAFRSINVIQGKPTIPPQLMLALANRTRELENITIKSDDESCTVTVKRKGREPHSETFGVKEATDMGLMGRDNYKKQRGIMFKWRALAANLRVTFPDAMIGFYTPEEMGAEVRVGEGESMEMVNISDISDQGIGVRAPAGYKKLAETDPKAAQERIGEDFEVRSTAKGQFIFPKESTKDLPDLPEPLITTEEQLTLIKLAKDKNVSQDVFRKHLKEKYGITGWSKIKKKDYSDVYQWVILNEWDAVESENNSDDRVLGKP